MADLDPAKLAREFLQLDDSIILAKLKRVLPYLKQVSEGKVYVESHNRWWQGSCKTRNALNWKSYSVSCVGGTQLEVIFRTLLQEFCAKSSKLNGYSMTVLFQEGVKQMVMEHFSINEKEAEDVVYAEICTKTEVADSSSSSESDSAADVLERARGIQKRMKKKGRGTSSCFPVTACSMMKRNRSYVKDGFSMEIMVEKTTTYQELAKLCSDALDMSPPEHGHVLALMTTGGAVIQESSEWTLGGYMQQQHRGPAKIKIGVGHIECTSPGRPDPAQSPASSASIEQTSGYGGTTGVSDYGGTTIDITDQTEEVNEGQADDSNQGLTVGRGKRKKRQDPGPSTSHPAAKNPAAKKPRVEPRETRYPVNKPEPGQCMEFFATELANATRNYSRNTVIGRGGYGTVFKGYVRHSVVAIKVLSQEGKDSFAKSANQLQKEVAALSRFRHENILQMLGFCSKPPAIVCEYMNEGSLYQKLHVEKSQQLTWKKRLGILKDSCRGIVYLHTAVPPLIHQDVKSANILLDERLRAKLGDFGFSLELPRVSSGHTMFTAQFIARSEGYYPSELSSGKISDRTDVYSFGVVVLETFCGQVAFDAKRSDPKLVDSLQDDLVSEAKFSVMYHDVLEQPPQNVVPIFFNIVTACLKRHSTRPPSSEVLQMFD